MTDRKDLHILERLDDDDDGDDGFYKYDVVGLDSGRQDEDNDDLIDALNSFQNLKSTRHSSNGNREEYSNLNDVITQVRPSAVDDFVRNFLVKGGMKNTLEIFDIEWYDLQSKGKLPEQMSMLVPDIYLKNNELDIQVGALKDQMMKMKDVASKAQSTWDMFRKERDFHRMHHKRVVHEKNKLINDIKMLRNHLRSYEPLLEEQKRRHEILMKEKMLLKLERDRLLIHSKTLEDQITNTPKIQTNDSNKKLSITRSIPRQPFMTDVITNPYLDVDFDPSNLNTFTISKSIKGHLNCISSSCFHPKKNIFATASDDETWKLWTISGDLIMSGEGHSSWISDITFHPDGSHIATCSGDGSVKVWELSKGSCSQTLSEHAQPVWACDFHYSGDYLASCSMDHSVKLWDLSRGKCRQTLRGHVDSVNALQFQPYTSNVCTVSGDKTLSIWDCRNGLCVQTLYGHGNAINDLCVTKRGDNIMSCDADGIVKCWDVRMVREVSSVQICSSSANKLVADRSGQRIAVASDDSNIYVLDTTTMTILSTLQGHEESVHCIALSPNDCHLISGSSDCTFKIWT